MACKRVERARFSSEGGGQTAGAGPCCRHRNQTVSALRLPIRNKQTSSFFAIAIVETGFQPWCPKICWHPALLGSTSLHTRQTDPPHRFDTKSRMLNGLALLLAAAMAAAVPAAAAGVRLPVELVASGGADSTGSLGCSPFVHVDLYGEALCPFT